MSFYVFTDSDGQHYRHVDKPPSVTALDSKLQPIGPTIEVDSDDYGCAASLAANRFAVGDWSSPLRLFNLETGVELRTYPIKPSVWFVFDATGRRLVIDSGSRVLLLDLKSGEVKHLKGVLAVDRSIKLPKRNTLLAVSQKRGELLRISLATGEMETISIPIAATMFDLRLNPAAPQAILIDKKKGIHCLDLKRWKLIWSVSLKKLLGRDHVGVGQFCGDGTLFGASAAGYDRNYVVVLDSQSGQVVNQFEGVADGIPYDRRLVRDSSTQKNSLLADAVDLSTGKKCKVSIDQPVKTDRRPK